MSYSLSFIIVQTILQRLHKQYGRRILSTCILPCSCHLTVINVSYTDALSHNLQTSGHNKSYSFVPRQKLEWFEMNRMFRDQFGYIEEGAERVLKHWVHFKNSNSSYLSFQNSSIQPDRFPGKCFHYVSLCFQLATCSVCWSQLQAVCYDCRLQTHRSPHSPARGSDLQSLPCNK